MLVKPHRERLFSNQNRFRVFREAAYFVRKRESFEVLVVHFRHASSGWYDLRSPYVGRRADLRSF
ncbi:hypothetical protein CGMCC3_g17180 [Colletotrichum fructicola]|nr:uncharacterized protein CGMCC3_g17180 [Colletotrichum fructicola]KAE9566652.1 hypothetical protein CGMCC3_g17180 [Colletotrichum fructicola]